MELLRDKNLKCPGEPSVLMVHKTLYTEQRLKFVPEYYHKFDDLLMKMWWINGSAPDFLAVVVGLNPPSVTGHETILLYKD